MKRLKPLNPTWPHAAYQNVSTRGALISNANFLTLLRYAARPSQTHLLELT
jgi:hypothetical protein